ncbi:MAG: tRNA 4-thiouridine(8) synthase ThiI [Oscillospiraceae bacterium]|nr:tRNA 4-thiouridine(8) synthase ThiI [Oscillospiraceae bacterium]
MKEVILLKSGEVALKGGNKPELESLLMKNIKARLKPLGRFRYTKAQSTISVEALDENTDTEEVLARLGKVFGIAAINRAACCEKSLDAIKATAAEALASKLSAAKTFKVEAKRSDKKFPYKSPDISRELGGYILDKFPNLKVDVHKPDIEITVEVRDFAAYIHAGAESGAGGLPGGSAGRAALMISGGIDSPVAGYMMARRGLELSGVHFESPPYTSERAKLKVIDLCKKVAEYSGRIKLFTVPFTQFQEELRDKCKEDYFTLIMRRAMYRISEILAVKNHCQALVTGENLGQVASQTMEALACTDIVCGMPVFRPLIGMDKIDIISLSRKIGTYELSILPYEDCCTVFTPRHPKTKPRLEDILEQESKLDLENLIQAAAEAGGTVWI